MTPKEEAEILHNRQRKQLWLDVYLECIKKPNAGWESAWYEATRAVQCFDEEFIHTGLFEPKQPTQ
jgi:hypothetical protein